MVSVCIVRSVSVKTCFTQSVRIIASSLLRSNSAALALSADAWLCQAALLLTTDVQLRHLPLGCYIRTVHTVTALAADIYCHLCIQEATCVLQSCTIVAASVSCAVSSQQLLQYLLVVQGVEQTLLLYDCCLLAAFKRVQSTAVTAPVVQ
jgi:hypothetical protein